MNGASIELRNLRDGRAALERAQELGEVSEIKRIGDMAVAARRFAEAQSLSEDARRFAAELALDAKRALGEVLAKAPKHPGGGDTGVNQHGSHRSALPTGGSEVLPPPALKDLGVSKTESSEAQRIARIPDDEYEQFKAASDVDGLNMRRALNKAREVDERRYAPIIDAGERDTRVRRSRIRRLLSEAYAAVAKLHVQIDDVIDAAQADDIDRHVEDLRRSAKMLGLIADHIDTPTAKCRPSAEPRAVGPQDLPHSFAAGLACHADLQRRPVLSSGRRFFRSDGTAILARAQAASSVSPAARSIAR